MNTSQAYTQVTEIHTDAPFWRLLEAYGTPWRALLDSSLTDGRRGRWSYLLPQVDLVVEARADKSPAGLLIRERGGDDGWTEEFRPGDPLELIGRIIASRRGDTAPEDSHPVFRSGAVGWFGHGAGRFTDRQPESGLDVDGLPDIRLMFGDVVAAHDATEGRTWLSTTGRGATNRDARRRAAALGETWRRRWEQYCPPPLPPLPATPRAVTPRTEVDAVGYAAKVHSIKQDILAGRVFEVNLTQTLEADLTTDPWTLYRILRETNPAPFAAFLETPEATIVSSSPERYLSLDRDGRTESRPIKGTRPRGSDPAADAGLRDELSESAKDRAENVMIVDLVRNDLGRVCETGSVSVSELCVVEGFATVWQMVSTVVGRLRDDCDALDLVRACHPPGSMTGAPKIEALAVIDEQETCRRGVYAGGIGFLDDHGAMDLHVVIRTAVVQGSRCRFGVGGAVTADSDPHAEYLEAMDKARALIRAICLANAIAG